MNDDEEKEIRRLINEALEQPTLKTFKNGSPDGRCFACKRKFDLGDDFVFRGRDTLCVPCARKLTNCKIDW